MILVVYEKMNEQECFKLVSHWWTLCNQAQERQADGKEKNPPKGKERTGEREYWFHSGTIPAIPIGIKQKEWQMTKEERNEAVAGEVLNHWETQLRFCDIPESALRAAYQRIRKREGGREVARRMLMIGLKMVKTRSCLVFIRTDKRRMTA